VPDIVSVTEYRVIYGDVDQMGVVYYGNYFRFFERGRAELVRERGLTYREIEEGRVALPVTEAYCHYHRPARYDDLLLIDTRIGRIRRASLRFDYRIFRRDEPDVLLVNGHTIHACTDPEGRIVRVPEHVLAVLG